MLGLCLGPLDNHTGWARRTSYNIVRIKSLRCSDLGDPSRFKIRHRFLPARRIASIMRVLLHPHRDRLEPRRVSVCCVRPHDAADVLVAVEHVVIVV
jgi:hypothetical protein